jgi:hypothetical protein
MFKDILKIIMHTSRQKKNITIVEWLTMYLHRKTLKGICHYKFQNPLGTHDFSKWKSMGSTDFPRMTYFGTNCFFYWLLFYMKSALFQLYLYEVSIISAVFIWSQHYFSCIYMKSALFQPISMRTNYQTIKHIGKKEARVFYEPIFC